MNKKTKALKVIVGLCLLNEEMALLNPIYRYAHVALDTCENKHPGWVQELDKVYEELKDKGVI